jgi:hypothetical protein
MVAAMFPARSWKSRAVSRPLPLDAPVVKTVRVMSPPTKDWSLRQLQGSTESIIDRRGCKIENLLRLIDTYGFDR